MRNKFMSLVLVAVLVLATALTGCGNKETDTAADNTKNAAAKVTYTVDDEGKINGVMYKEGLPIVDPGTFEFSVFTDGNKTSDDFYLMPILEEQTGVKVDVQLFPYEVAKEKYSLALHSGDYADSIGGWILSANDILKFGVEMGTFIPLEGLIKEFAPNIEAVLNLKGVRDIMTAPDGHIYSIPYVLSAPTVDFNPYINTRWLDNLGLEMPTNTDELREVLIAFKEQDANGNGDAGDEIPFSFDLVNKHLGYYAGWFGMPVNNNGFTMVDGELIFGATSEEYKAMVVYMRDLYAEGLLDPEMFTIDQNQWKARGANDIYGTVMCYGSGDFMPYETGETPDFMPLPVLKSDMTDSPLWFRSSYGTAVLKNQVVVTDNASNPEVIVRWWDNMFELENSLQTNGGPLNIKLFKDEATGGYYIDDTHLTEDQKELYSWGNLYPQSLPRYIPTDFRWQEKIPVFEEKDNACKEYEPYLMKNVIPSYWADAEVAATLSEMEISIREYVEQKTAEWIAGQADIDAEWDDYLKQLDKFKLDEYIQLKRDALNQI